jgi:hypoxanthine phosphoribosyltransferase
LVDCPVRYSGFTALDQFVVGYGFDYRQQFRDLPDIHVLQMP